MLTPTGSFSILVIEADPLFQMALSDRLEISDLPINLIFASTLEEAKRSEKGQDVRLVLTSMSVNETLAAGMQARMRRAFVALYKEPAVREEFSSFCCMACERNIGKVFQMLKFILGGYN